MPKSPEPAGQISIVIPIQVFGTEITGQDFMESTETRLVCREEAVIVLRHRVAPLQQITIRNAATGAEATARIIGQVGGTPESRLHGIALLDPAVNLWKANFPPAREPEAPRAPLCLQCGGCGGREQIALSRIERDVFRASGCISRPCPRCGEPTVWRVAVGQTPAAGRESSRLPEKQQPQPTISFADNACARPNTPLRMAMSACVLEPRFGAEDLVRVECISRAGLSFLSPCSYALGCEIRVAAPYMKGTENVFVPARIDRTELVPGGNLKRYGISFIHRQLS
jgi:hypothetical protein